MNSRGIAMQFGVLLSECDGVSQNYHAWCRTGHLMDTDGYMDPQSVSNGEYHHGSEEISAQKSGNISLQDLFLGLDE